MTERAPDGAQRPAAQPSDAQTPDDDVIDEAIALVDGHRPPVPQAPAASTASQAPAAHNEHHRATPWPDARALAARAGERAAAGRTPEAVPLAGALGRVLAGPLEALTDLPSFNTSAMDGWAVAGPGPWRIDPEGAVLAGHAPARTLADGDAVRIATGGRVPAGTTAVVRSEHSRTESTSGVADSTDSTDSAHGTGHAHTTHTTPGRLHALREVVPGQDIRPRGQECRAGDRLLPAGSTVTPAVLGLAAAAGYDELSVHPRPRVEVLVLGDELLASGLPHEGLIRDALGPLLAPWLRALGVQVVGTRRIGDDAEALYGAVTGSAADVVVTTGGTAAGPVDHVHPVLAKAGATLLVDGVKVRPGHPMLLARLADGRHLVGLPGNPLAAVSGLLTLAEPLLRALAGRPAGAPYRAVVRDEVHGHPYDTRLVPVQVRGAEAVPLHYNGPAMLRSIAAAHGMAVIPPGGARAGQSLDVLDLPWRATAGAPDGACFT
ncbi:molybdopterin molybdotransferase MoeA [Streptomyces sp. NPDC101160]|uniref:molybdopterin molybdotransferase MoeA n=1 Tax=Streptomyces sp. NPDC101160 TaxID=3366118 RepID=UPI0037F52156